MGVGSAEPLSALQCIDEQIMRATDANELSRRANALTRRANKKRGVRQRSSDAIYGAQIGERVSSEAIDVNSVRSRDARSRSGRSQQEHSQQEHRELACSQAGGERSERG